MGADVAVGVCVGVAGAVGTGVAVGKGGRVGCSGAVVGEGTGADVGSGAGVTVTVTDRVGSLLYTTKGVETGSTSAATTVAESPATGSWLRVTWTGSTIPVAATMGGVGAAVCPGARATGPSGTGGDAPSQAIAPAPNRIKTGAAINLPKYLIPFPINTLALVFGVSPGFMVLFPFAPGRDSILTSLTNGGGSGGWLGPFSDSWLFSTAQSEQYGAAIHAVGAVEGLLRVAIPERPEPLKALYGRPADIQLTLATEVVSLRRRVGGLFRYRRRYLEEGEVTPCPPFPHRLPHRRGFLAGPELID